MKVILGGYSLHQLGCFSPLMFNVMQVYNISHSSKAAAIAFPMAVFPKLFEVFNPKSTLTSIKYPIKQISR